MADRSPPGATTTDGERVASVGGRLGYRPALDGLRAVAVLGVMAWHADLPGAAGGYLGVTAFFVLSGFLITTLLIEEHAATGRIPLGAFYARRAIRLFPAFLVMVTVVVGVVALTERDVLTSVIRAALVAVAYVADFGHLLGVKDTYLVHTWTLAMEEQFYAIWPLVLILALRRWTARELEEALWLATAALIVAAANVAGPGGVLQLPWWALVGGAALALSLRRGLFTSARPLGRALPWIAMCAVGLWALLVATLTDASRSRQWGETAAAVAIAVMIAEVVVHRDGVLARLGAWKPAVHIGTLSYALYLWHVPVFRWIAQHYHLPYPLLVAIQFGVAYALALASWHLIEKPTRRWRARYRLAAIPSGVGTPTATAQ